MASHGALLAGRYVVDDDDAGSRLDRFLASRIETLSRARLQELIRGGHVTRAADAGGEAVTDPSAKVRAGDSFTVNEPAAEPYAVAGEQIELKVVYEDESLIVIDKPAGLVVHPGAGNQSGTLVNALIAHCGESLSGIGGVARPGIVHRLDKDTSGVMVVAKTDAAHRGLAAQFADHGRTGELRREYLALVWGEPNPRAGRIETLIGRHLSSRIKMAVVPAGGRVAITNYKTEQDLSRARSKGCVKGEREQLDIVKCRSLQPRNGAHASSPGPYGSPGHANCWRSPLRSRLQDEGSGAPRRRRPKFFWAWRGRLCTRLACASNIQLLGKSKGLKPYFPKTSRNCVTLLRG